MILVLYTMCIQPFSRFFNGVAIFDAIECNHSNTPMGDVLSGRVA